MIYIYIYNKVFRSKHLPWKCLIHIRFTFILYINSLKYSSYCVSDMFIINQFFPNIVCKLKKTSQFSKFLNFLLTNLEIGQMLNKL